MTVVVHAIPRTRFAMPTDREATSTPEQRGLERDQVRLLVVRPDTVADTTFRTFPDHLESGDLLVVNTSATLAAALDVVRMSGAPGLLHVAGGLDDGSWVVEVRRPDNSGPAADVRIGEPVRLPGGGRLVVQASYPRAGVSGSRLWRAAVPAGADRASLLRTHGRPIGYRYLHGPVRLADVQTVYADEAGSAEMPSAGRPITDRLLTRLMMRGVVVAPLVLHTSVSSPEKHEPPVPEQYWVPEATARLVNSTRVAGHRVVAVGTTVVRALESVAEPDGTVHADAGWTDLVIGPERAVRAVDGLVSGLHEPQASHLLLLEAVAGTALVAAGYEAAVAERYLWHEFGDSMLFLPALQR